MIVALPWDAKSADTLDIAKTKEVFEKHHYGMQDVKDRFLEYVSVLASKQKNNAARIVHALLFASWFGWY